VQVTPQRFQYAAFTVSSSGTDAVPITIESTNGTGYDGVDSLTAATHQFDFSASPIAFDGASYIKIEGINTDSGYGEPDIDLAGSSHVTVDSSVIDEETTNTPPNSNPAVWIHGGSSASVSDGWTGNSITECSWAFGDARHP
jgi:hypothetical protein